MIYSHVSNKDLGQIKSPLDRLFGNKKGGGWSKRMILERFGEIKFSSGGMYIRSTSDILPKWKDIRNSYIPPNWNDMRSIADIPKLYAMPPLGV
jgi:hypothetical protein